jgi:hypothetical protein
MTLPRSVKRHVTYRAPKKAKRPVQVFAGAPVGSLPNSRAPTLEERVLRIEQVLGLAPKAADPDCQLCHGTGEVNWGQPGRAGGKVGKCLCRMTPDERRSFGR